jgi:hypothetical protein
MRPDCDTRRAGRCKRRNTVLVPLVLACCLSGLVGATTAGEEGLIVSPSQLRLEDAFERRQLLVRLGSRDVTADCQYECDKPGIVSIENDGYVVPIGPGRGKLLVTCGAQRASVPVVVAAYDSGRPIDFGNEVVPVLTRFGCNAGGCHGKASGQNGFKLSLFGFDAAFDYDAIVLAARGRRVFPSAPQQSLLLLKASAATPHGGGRRLVPDDEAYRMLVRWISQGMPRSLPSAPHIVRLLVDPEQRVLRSGEVQQLSVQAEYSDGSRRDVTRQAQYASNLDRVATIDERGRVQCGTSTGEAAVMVRYMGQVAVFRALVRREQPLDVLTDFQPRGYIDELVAAKWKKLGLGPSPPATDGEFLRRVTIDLTGRLPGTEELQAFLADTSADKRSQAIDRLLDSPDYAALYAMRWGTILRNSARNGGTGVAFHNWLRDQIARNQPYDQFVRAIIAVSGEPAEAPPVNRYWQMRDDLLNQVTADTAQVFLGIRIQCAQCHHHPYEKWSQDDYYGLAGFFMRLATKGGSQPFILYASSQVRNDRDPRNGGIPQPRFLDGQRVEIPAEVDPRQVLVDWMARADNPFFARMLVNRYWGQLMGRGLVEPVDDMRSTNPPSNPELLDALADDFVTHNYDMKHVLRTIANSAVYQLSSEPTEQNRSDQQNFARYYGRRLLAEVFLDAVDQVCGTRTSFAGLPARLRAVDLPHEGIASRFLDTFDRPGRLTGCECERATGANLAQALMLSNSTEIESKLTTSGRIASAIQAGNSSDTIVRNIYLAAFARVPTTQEMDRALQYVRAKHSQREALEDVLWVILNSKEFALNH